MIAILVLAVGLAMDAFAVALVRGARGERSWRAAMETGIAFGAAQGLMPLAGWLLGSLFMALIADVDHWIAFVLLAVLGARMIIAGLSSGDGEDDDAPTPGGRALLVAALATSIDAAAAGLTLDFFALPVAASCLVIALVTTVLCVASYRFAASLGAALGKRAEVLGGLVLIGLGLKIVLDHTGLI